MIDISLTKIFLYLLLFFGSFLLFCFFLPPACQKAASFATIITVHFVPKLKKDYNPCHSLSPKIYFYITACFPFSKVGFSSISPSFLHESICLSPCPLLLSALRNVRLICGYFHTVPALSCNCRIRPTQCSYGYFASADALYIVKCFLVGNRLIGVLKD